MLLPLLLLVPDSAGKVAPSLTNLIPYYVFVVYVTVMCLLSLLLLR